MNNLAFKKTGSAVSAAVVLAIGCVSQAHAGSNVLSSTGSLSKLSYTLTDLDPNDGMKASVTFGSSESTELMVLDQTLNGPYTGNNDNVVGSVFHSGNGSATQAGIDAKASKTGNGLNTQVQYSNKEAQTLLTQPYNTGEITLAYHGRTADITPNGSLGGMVGETFTLAPHTSITFTGQFTGSANVDMTSLLNSPAFSKMQAVEGSMDASVWTFAELLIQHPYWTWPTLPNVPTDVQDATGGAEAHGTLDALGHVVTDNTKSQASTTLSVTFSNTTDAPIDSTIDFELRSEAYLNVMAVPEASTWAMEALGLAGLTSVVARARRRRQQA